MNVTGAFTGNQQLGNVIYSIGGNLDIISTDRNSQDVTLASITGLYEERFYITGSP